MDAAQKQFKNLVLFLVIALSLSAPVWAYDTPSFVISNNNVTLSTSVTGVDVTIRSSLSPAAEITFAASAANYGSDTCGSTACHWLNVVQQGGTTPATVALNVGNIAGLPAGAHTATVTLTASDPAGVAAGTITVNYNNTVTGGGGTLTSSQNPITLFAASGSSVSTTAAISTTSVNPISISITTQTTSCTFANWLFASNQGSSTITNGFSTNMLVTMNATGLSSGVCQGTITISPSAGSNLVIPVTFNVNTSGGGGGSLTASQNPIPFSFTTNSGSFPNTNVTISGSTSSGQFNATTNCGGGWLLVNGATSIFNQSVGNSITVSVGGTANSLSTSVYTCFISLSDSNSSGIVLYTITVNLTVNGASSGGLTISPSSVSLSAQVGGVQQQTTISATTQSGGVLSNITASSSTGWLSYSSAFIGQTISAGGTATITVFANPSGLSANTYSGTLNITIGSQTTSVPVTFTVGGGGGGTGATVVAPSTINLSYQTTTSFSFISQPTIAITGPSGNWNASISYNGSASGWLSISPGSGTLPSQNTARLVATPAGLAVGTYTATVTVTTANGAIATATVNLNVVSGSILLTNPGSAVFNYTIGGSLPTAIAVNPVNSDSSTLNFTTTASDTFVQVSQQPGSTVFSVNVDPTGKNAGVYTSSVVINENTVTNNPVSFPVVLVVNGNGTTGSTLSFFPSSLNFNSQNGAVPASQNLQITANVQSTFTVSSNATWLTVSPNSGTTTTNLTVSANPSGLANNTTYNGTLTFNSNGSVQTVGVTFVLGTGTGGGGNGGNVTVTCLSSCGGTPPSLSFSGQVGAGQLPVGALSIATASGGASVNFTMSATTTTGGSWLSTSAGQSVLSTPSGSISINVNVGGAGGLAAGTYTGNIAVIPTGGTTVNVPVTLTVLASPTVTAVATPLTFSYSAGGAAPASQTIAVSSNTGTLSFSVVASPSGSWLSATPATGTTPGTVTVAINPASLTAGTYTGTVTIAGTDGALGSTVVNITLTVTAPLPTLARVVNGASYQANAISPGEVITLFASDAQHPIGPATPVGLALDSSGKVATTLGGVQVLINGFACPMIYASATQVSAVAPYEIAPLTSATVLVKFVGQSSNGVPVNVATTSPGLFTLNSSGTGPGAILNQNQSTNAPNNPASRGDTVVLYLTGEGQTSPTGVTGKVTTVSSTPPLTPGPLLPIAILINGQAATYSFAGEAPGFVSGVLQLNVVIPANLTLPANGADSPLSVSIGSNSTQTGVTISIK